jgi:hypothetical protein
MSKQKDALKEAVINKANDSVEKYISEFKDDIKQKALELINDPDLSKESKDILNAKMINLVQYVYDYGRMKLTKEQVPSRTRITTIVPLAERCCAKIADGSQCTRRKQSDSVYCGTHLKGVPHGVCDIDEDIKPQGKKVQAWVQDIQGIMYYIDDNNNVYQMEDIMMSKPNPKVIAKYVKVGDVYTIPAFR